jgi:hypothetical protein
MAEPGGRRSEAAEKAGGDLGKVVKAGPAGVLPAVMIILAVIAIFVLGIMLLFRQ